jgi:ABC-type phosphate transport system permease subunit
MERRYHALRTIGNIYRVLGYIVLVITILAVIAICGLSVISGTALQSVSQQLGVDSGGSGVAGGIVGGLILSFFALIYGVLISISLIAFGEGIYLLIAIEENTRKTALLVDNQNKITPSAPPA